MNARMKELLAQSRLFCYNDGTVSLLGESYAGQPEIEKFAELIIQECMQCCTKVEEDRELSDYQGGFRDGALLCREEIKSHFGVKDEPR